MINPGRLGEAARDALESSGEDKQEFYTGCTLVAFGVLRLDGSEADYEQLVDGSHLGKSYQYSDRKRAVDMANAWAWAEEQYEPDTGAKREEIREELENLAGRLSGLPRHLVPTMRAVLEVGIERGAYSMNLACRDLAVATGASPATVARHLVKLEDLGILDREAESVGYAQKLVINLAWGEVPKKGIVQHINTYGGDTYMSHFSLFSRHGLGPTAALVWQSLCSRVEQLPSSVARRAKVDPKTARSHLPRLVDAGLAVARTVGARTWYARTPAPDLDAVAEVLGIEESIAEKEEQIAIQRELWARARPEQEAQPEPAPSPAHEPRPSSAQARRARINRAVRR